jgi:glycosyltransferase involved in cell wall biosynthesis
LTICTARVPALITGPSWQHRALSVSNRTGRIRIGLDARTMLAARPRGTGRNLLDAYRLIPALRPDWEFVLYHQGKPADSVASPNPAADGKSTSALACVLAAPNIRLRPIDIPGDRFDLWFQARLPAAAWRDRVDLLHLPANVAPACCPVPLVVTVHDLIPLEVEDEYGLRQRRAFRRGVERAVRQAVHIISPSKATRVGLEHVFGVPPERITVIPWAPDRGIASAVAQRACAETGWPGRPARGVAHAGSASLPIEQVRTRYRLDAAWLLNFSGFSSRKNALGLIEAFARLSPKTRGDVQLVLVGCEPGAFRVALRTHAEKLGVRTCLRVLGFVPAEDLPGLLMGARGLVMPSLCEGFGLPILDAFVCGTPVLTSNVSSLPEVAGDAALYCDPRSTPSMAKGIARLLNLTTGSSAKRAGGAYAGSVGSGPRG